MYKDHETPRFWISYGESLKRYVEKNIADKNAVNDILHEVYLKIFTHCKRFDFCCDKAGVKNLRAWVFAVCRHTIADYRKERQKLCQLPDDCQLDKFVTMAGVNEQPLQMDQVLKTLPPKYAEALWYDSVLQLKQAVIADKLGLTISATKSRIQRGKKMLREIYSRQL